MPAVLNHPNLEPRLARGRCAHTASSSNQCGSSCNLHRASGPRQYQLQYDDIFSCIGYRSIDVDQMTSQSPVSRGKGLELGRYDAILNTARAVLDELGCYRVTTLEVAARAPESAVGERELAQKMGAWSVMPLTRKPSGLRARMSPPSTKETTAREKLLPESSLNQVLATPSGSANISAVDTRLRPPRFASYRARSAALTRASGVLLAVGTTVATPKLTVTN